MVPKLPVSKINKVNIMPMKADDWTSVAKIYNDGISSGFATFETSAPDYANWNKAHLKACRLIATLAQETIGWAALSPVSGRCVYGGVAEVSIYIATSARGLGIGKLLMKQLITDSEKEGIWTLQSGIFPENKASIELHKSIDFRYIGKREKIGKTAEGVWKDNLLFERRSTAIGID